LKRPTYVKPFRVRKFEEFTMRPSKIRALSVLLGACYCLFIGAPSYADDTEIFGSGGGVAAGLKPNILFIVDTSGSMDTLVETINNPFDPGTTYQVVGTCDKNYVYWIPNTGAAPDCGTNQKFPLSELTCDAAVQGFALGGQYIAFKAAMWNPANNRKKWMNIRAGVNNQPVECQADAGVHGATAGDSKVYARNGDNANLWSSKKADAITWSGADNADRTYTLFSGNYLNWYNDPTNRTLKSRLQIVKDVASSLANSIDNVNLGVMRYSNNGGSGETVAEGGMVVQPISDIATSRTNIINTINAFQPDGYTPLSETLYEAGQYFAGRKVDFGLNSRLWPGSVNGVNGAFPSVPASRQAADQSLYQSPIKYSCQKNYVVYLTDGLPTEDNDADNKITALPNYTSLLGTNSCDDSGPGRCLDDMAEYLFKADLNSKLDGKQNVITYTIGFGPEVSGSTFLEKVAKRGGGEAYSADDTTSLAQVLSGIVATIVQTNTTFTSPSVSVNAFNRTQTLDDIYVSLFQPSENYHWPGNVKKYKVVNGEIDGVGNVPAIDSATGFFAKSSQSYWGTGVDGSTVTAGGAASQIPAPDVRKVYTYLGSNTALTDVSNALVSTNAGITDALLGLGAPGQPVRADLIDWIRGRDVADDDADGDFNEERFVMGDPIHAKPAIVIYGGSAAIPNVNDAVVYSVTNDGYLHAIDVSSGQELWSFVPQELLANMPALFDDATSVDKHYALDGDLRVFKLDRNGNGVVEPTDGDKVLLYFGMRRGGSNYYALDITDKSAPTFKWVIGPASLPGVGETWSTPAVAKVNVAGSGQSADKYVLIFGGGYNDSQDNSPYSTDSIGNRIYMIDADTGALLWYASGATTGTPAANLTFNAAPYLMNNSFPADILVLDMDQDGYADRMYTVDMGGRLWRFDIQNGQAASSLVHGGIIARLGDGDNPSVTDAKARRLYSTPDAAIVRDRGINPYLALAFGSGYRGHPLNTTIRDRFYMIKDKVPFTSYTTQAAFSAQFTSGSGGTIATDSGSSPALSTDVQDVTDNLNATVPAAALGWKLELREGASTWIGEKSLSGASIFNNRVFFTTYTPQTTPPVDPCTPGQGSNRAYVVSLLNGAPVADLDGQTSVNRADRYKQLKQGGIAPEIVFLFPGNNSSNTSGSGSGSGTGSGGTTSTRGLLCLSGVEVLAGVCVNAGASVRTFWQESGTN
jgi:type IV pilus assembly protein PilY1